MTARAAVAPKQTIISVQQTGGHLCGLMAQYVRHLMYDQKLKTGEYRLYSRKADPQTGKRRNLGTFSSRQQAEKHERAAVLQASTLKGIFALAGKPCIGRKLYGNARARHRSNEN